MKNLPKAIGFPAILIITLTVATPVWAQSMPETMQPMEGMMVTGAPIKVTSRSGLNS